MPGASVEATAFRRVRDLYHSGRGGSGFRSAPDSAAAGSAVLVLSSQIEGTQSTLDDLLAHEIDEVPGAPIEDVREVSRYVDAMAYGMGRLAEGFPLVNRLLREMHGILLANGRGAEKQPGEFRRSQNWIGGTRLGNAAFVPPPPQRMDECLADLERFLHEPVNPIIKAALAHVQFETIHPFLDGNGRVGRLLITLSLINDSVLKRPLLYPSLYFKEHRQDYSCHKSESLTNSCHPHPEKMWCFDVVIVVSNVTL